MSDDADRAELPFPLSGSTLVTGPSNVGKTRLTARALEAWVAENGDSGVVVLDFAPEIRRDGRVLGGRLSRFVSIPDRAWCGVLEAHAPRAATSDDSERLALARDNASRARRLFESAPAPRAVFVNDATIPFQSPDADLAPLLAYCDRAGVAVLNALDSDELGTGDPVSRAERDALDALETWADRVLRLDDESPQDDGGPDP